MTTATKPRDVFVYSERFTDEVKLIARLGEIIQARAQFAVSVESGVWVVSYPAASEVQP